MASFETPSASQFAVAETGTDARPSPIYEPGSCDLDDDLGIICDYAYPALSFDALASPDTDGMLFIDEGGARFQRYVEDCQVCCRPMQVFVAPDEEGLLSATVERLDA